MRIRDAHKAKIRRALLSAGTELIAEHGIDHTTVEEITRRAGVAKGTFYNYFSTKEELVLAAVAARQSDWKAELADVMRAHTRTSARLQETFRRAADWIEANPEVTWVWSLARISGAQQPSKQTLHGPGTFHQILTEICQAGQTDDELRADRSASLLATDLEGLFFIHVVRWYRERAEHDVKLFERLDASLQTYLQGCAPSYNGAEGDS